MTNLKKHYARAIEASFLARLSNVIGGAGTIWLLTQILSKSDFGDFFFSFSIIIVIAALNAAFFQRLILFHVSEWRNAPKSYTYFSSILIWAILIGFTLSAILGIAASFFYKNQTTSTTASWFLFMSGLVGLESLRHIGVSWYRAHQNIRSASILEDIAPNILRLSFLGIVFFFGIGELGIIFSLYLASALPLAVFLCKEKVLSAFNMKFLLGGDLSYGLKLLLTQTINQPSRRLDVVILGVLSSSSQVADYAVASRICNLLLLGKQLITPLLVPRIRQCLSGGQVQQALKEFYGASFFSALFAVSGCIGLLILGPTILNLFGEYSEAQNVIIILSIAMLLRATTGPAGEFLAMTGRSAGVLAATVIGVGATIVIAVFTVPNFGATGMAYALIFGALFTNGTIILITAYQQKYWLLNTAAFFNLTLIVCVMLASANDLLSPIEASLILLGASIFYLKSLWNFWTDLRSRTTKTT